MKILIAGSDQESINQIIMIFQISQPDWIISSVLSGKECLEIIENGNINSPDVLVSMTQLTDMPVYELIEKIRDDSDISIIVLSDDKDIQTLVNAFDAGANDFVVMPFNKAIFIARIKAVVRRREWDIRAVNDKLMNVND